MCEVWDVLLSLDFEDGIMLQVEEVFNGRKVNLKVDCWDMFWDVLFGMEEGIFDYSKYL